MMTILDRIIGHLEEAKRCAEFQKASFGFPNDQLEIKSVHFDNDLRGRQGELIHPNEYIHNVTKLYRETWIIPPIEQALNLLKLHADTLRDVEELSKALAKLNIEGIIKRAQVGYTQE